MLRRSQLQELTFQYLREPSPLKADVKLYEFSSGKVIVKDVGEKSWGVRLIVGYLVRREARMLAKAQGIEGVPQLIGRIDRYAFAMQFLEGEPMKGVTRRGGLPDSFLERLQALVLELHRRGIVHLDLRQKRNIIIREEGSPAVVDFASAVYLGRTPFLGFIVRLGGLPDISAIVKYRLRYRARASSARRRFCYYFRVLVRYLLRGEIAD